MRRILGLLFFCAASACAQTNDIRTVSNIRVDLTPLRSWLITHDGERPLKHWKEIEIVGIEKYSKGRTACRIKVEGEEKIVLLRNAEVIIKLLSNITNNLEHLVDVEMQISSIENKLATIKGMSENEARGVTSAHDEGMRLLVEMKSFRLKYEHLRGEMLPLVPTLSRDLAMFTKNKDDGLEVWDCGKKLAK
jgi:hypothetical protein